MAALTEKCHMNVFDPKTFVLTSDNKVDKHLSIFKVMQTKLFGKMPATWALISVQAERLRTKLEDKG